MHGNSVPSSKRTSSATIASVPQSQGGSMGPLLLALTDVELTPVPPMAFFRISVHPAGPRGPATHHVMKRYTDLQDFHNAISRELRAEQLPRLPAQRPEREYESPAFWTELGGYLARLADNPDAVETYSFKNFFQLSEEYQWSEPQRTPASSHDGLLRTPPGSRQQALTPPGSRQQGLAQSPHGSNSAHRQDILGQSPVSMVGRSPPSRRGQQEVRAPSPLGVPVQASPSRRGYPTPSTPHQQDSRYYGGSGCLSMTSPANRGSDRTPTAAGASAGINARSCYNDFQPAQSAPEIPGDAAALYGPTPTVPRTTDGLEEAQFMPRLSGGSPQLSRNIPVACRESVSPDRGSPGQLRTPFPLQASTQQAAKDTSRLSNAKAALPHASTSFGSDDIGSSGDGSGMGRRRPRRAWCVICMANPQEMAIDPCGHLSMCHACCSAVKTCPVCRGPIDKALRIYVA